MSAYDYFCRMCDLGDGRCWLRLQKLLQKRHPVLPGEREAGLRVISVLGEQAKIRLDETGMHIIPKK